MLLLSTFVFIAWDKFITYVPFPPFVYILLASLFSFISFFSTWADRTTLAFTRTDIHTLFFSFCLHLLSPSPLYFSALLFPLSYLSFSALSLCLLPSFLHSLFLFYPCSPCSLLVRSLTPSPPSFPSPSFSLLIYWVVILLAWLC